MAEKDKKFDFTKLKTLAVVSIATALTSIGAVAAIITGHVALTQIKKSDELFISFFNRLFDRETTFFNSSALK